MSGIISRRIVPQAVANVAIQEVVERDERSELGEEVSLQLEPPVEDPQTARTTTAADASDIANDY